MKKKELNNATRIGIVERLEKHRVDHGEHCCVGAHAQGQGQDCRRRKALRTAHRPKRVSNVLAGLRQPEEGTCVAMRLSRKFQIAALELRRPAGLCRSQPPPQKFLFKKSKVRVDLPFKIRISLSAGREVPQLRNGLRNAPVHACFPSRSSRSTNSDILLQRVVSFSNARRPAGVIA